MAQYFIYKFSPKYISNIIENDPVAYFASRPFNIYRVAEIAVSISPAGAETVTRELLTQMS